MNNIFKKTSPILFFSFLLSTLFLVFAFLFNPHYIELSILENWFFTKGLVWYKQFPAEHFPLGRLILLPEQLLFNWNFHIDPFFALFFAIISLWMIYKFGKKYFTNLGTSIGIIFFGMFYWYFATGILFFHEILIAVLILWAMKYLFKLNENKILSNRQILFFGILLSLIELSGQIATPTVGIFALLVAYLAIRQTRNIQKLKTNFIYLVLGFFIPFTPFLIYCLINNSLSEFIYYNITYYLTYTQDASKNLLTLPYNIIFVFYLPLIIQCLLLFSDKNRTFQNISIFLLSLSTIPGVLLSIFHFHHFNYALTILSLGMVINFSQKYPSKFIKNAIWTGVIVSMIYTFIAIILPWHTSRIIFPPSLRIYNAETQSGDNTHETIEWIINNTKGNDRIMVIGTSIVYFKTNRLPASRPAKGIPYTWIPIDKVGKEILASPPDYWIIDVKFLNRVVENNNRKEIKNFMDIALANCYKKVQQFNNWEIWQRSCK